jgi:uncharacterized protein YjbI with pentapeptide repeats
MEFKRFKSISKETLDQKLKDQENYINGISKKPADFSGYNLDHICVFHDKDLTGANFSNANLSMALLDNANLTRANLSWANLSMALLDNANLTEANLIFADFKNADLVDANLYNATLRETNFKGADLTGAVVDTSDLLKNGFTDDTKIDFEGQRKEQTKTLKDYSNKELLTEIENRMGDN